MLGTYFQGRVTPDGPMVTKHSPPDFEAVTLPFAEYQWGHGNNWPGVLAFDLVEELLGVQPNPAWVAGVDEELIQRLPAGEPWRLEASQILDAVKRNDIPF
jgi:hypothetical protein